jgi:hypothetical protein
MVMSVLVAGLPLARFGERQVPITQGPTAKCLMRGRVEYPSTSVLQEELRRISDEKVSARERNVFLGI